MSEYKISIVIPAFNLEDKIERAFNSIKNQTIGFENIEVLFVDDQSTDKTFNIINDFANEFDNVLIFQTESNSRYAGKPRNIGLENASADYVLFLDGDDELLINSCEVLYNKIISTDSDIAIGGQINVFEGIPQHNRPLINGEERIFTNMKNPETLSIRPAISAKLFKNELLKDNNIRFPEGTSGQDLVFLINALLNSSQTIVLNTLFAYYRILSDDSVSFNIHEEYLKGLITSYIQVCELFDEFDVPQSVQEQAIHQHISFFTSQIIRTDIDYHKEMLPRLLNSDLFKKLAGKNVFENNVYYKEYFKRMSEGEYDNYNLLDKVIEPYEEEDMNHLKNLNEKLYSENCILNEKWDEINQNPLKLKNDLTKLKEELNIIKDENTYLKKNNTILAEKCEKLQNENDEIKSSTLWKLTKRS